MITPLDIEFFGQLILAVSLGALIGLERSLAHKKAGMRTFAFVALGSALFSIISVNAGLGFDPTRIAAQIVTGVGFIGAGIIIFSRSQLHGVTTAASLWLSSAIGMAVGFRFYTAAIFTTFLALLVLTIFWFIEEKLIQKFGFQSSPDDSGKTDTDGKN